MDVTMPMPVALLAAFVTLGVSNAAPLEPSATRAVQKAQRQILDGDLQRALASLDSLLFEGGVSVSLETASDMSPAVQQGLDAWNSSLGETVFRWKPTGEVADVTVRFVGSIEQQGADVQGYVRSTREMSWSSRSHSYRIHATILVRDNIDGHPLRMEEVTNVVAHEAGHLLGLADASHDGCLMGRLVVGRPLAGPLASEVDAVRAYRGMIRESYPKAVDKG